MSIALFLLNVCSIELKTADPSSEISALKLVFAGMAEYPKEFEMITENPSNSQDIAKYSKNICNECMEKSLGANKKRSFFEFLRTMKASIRSSARTALSSRRECERMKYCHHTLPQALSTPDGCQHCKNIIIGLASSYKDTNGAQIVFKVVNETCPKLRFNSIMCSNVTPESASKFISFLSMKINDQQLCSAANLC